MKILCEISQSKSYRIGISVLLSLVVATLAISAISGGAAAQAQNEYIIGSDHADGTITAIDADDRSQIWQTNVSEPDHVEVDDQNNIVYAQSVSSQVYALDLETGEILWNTSLTNQVKDLAADSDREFVYAISQTSSDTYLTAVNNTNGSVHSEKALLTGDVFALDYAAEIDRIIIAEFGSISVHNASTYDDVWSVTDHQDPVTAIEYAPSSNDIVSGGVENDIYFTDVDTQSLKKTYAANDAQYSDQTEDITYSEELNTTLAVSDGSSDESFVHILDHTTNNNHRELKILKQGSSMTNIDYSADLNKIIARSDVREYQINASELSISNEHAVGSDDLILGSVASTNDLTLNIEDEYGPVSNLNVTVGGAQMTVSDADTITLAEGSYEITVQDSEYESQTITADLSSGSVSKTLSLTSTSIDKVIVNVSSDSVTSVTPQSWESEVLQNDSLGDANPDIYLTEQRYVIEGVSGEFEVVGDNGTVLLSQNTTGEFESSSYVNWVDNADTVEFTVTPHLADRAKSISPLGSDIVTYDTTQVVDVEVRAVDENGTLVSQEVNYTLSASGIQLLDSSYDKSYSGTIAADEDSSTERVVVDEYNVQSSFIANNQVNITADGTLILNESASATFDETTAAGGTSGSDSGLGWKIYAAIAGVILVLFVFGRD